ncbi:CPBP family intramembrane glutamic endopeptidase [Ruminococcus flavefaciens]|uniref:CPBP family intramembrane glutamic endopeptidase n=1 Tax=Ruminococcus flavefaciens TaxID=1265 RepID=UPI000491B8B2|nr:CPBP family intramembrane glutamic endopeptidase [Ruminococcus flavefaciens]
MLKYRPKMFEEASDINTSRELIFILISFVIVFMIILAVESFIPSAVSAKTTLKEFIDLDTLNSSGNKKINSAIYIYQSTAARPAVMLSALYSTIFGTICSLIYCRFVEARPVSSMGVKKAKLLPNYILGLIVGMILMTTISLLSVLLGINSIKFSGTINAGLIALYFFGFVIQGMSEEFIFRGYFMTTIGGSGKHTLVAVGISSLAFGIAHSCNTGFGFLPFLNVVLFGVFAAFYMILSENIWGVCAIHSIWNFTQGNFYGISVSGTGANPSVFRTTANNSSVLFTGGEFGIEGSILTTIVLLIATAAVVYGISKKSAAQQSEAAVSEVVNE